MPGRTRPYRKRSLEPAPVRELLEEPAIEVTDDEVEAAKSFGAMIQAAIRGASGQPGAVREAVVHGKSFVRRVARARRERDAQGSKRR